MGATSFGVIENRNILAHSGNLEGRRFWYGRIDAAVVPMEYRGYGVGRWLLEANLLYMLRTWPGDLYSLSTIAAHKAVAYVLSQLGFRVEAKEGMTEEKVSIDIDDGSEENLGEALLRKVEKSGSLVFFRIRKNGGL